MTADDLKTLIALWGALTGTVGIVMSLYGILRDRSRLTIRLAEYAHDDAVKVVSEQLNALGGQCVVFAEVVNAGRRVRHVYRAELWTAADNLLLHHDARMVFIDAKWRQCTEAWESWRLEEGQSVTFAFSIAERRATLRVDVPDSLAHNIKVYRRVLWSRMRWVRARLHGGKRWKELRSMAIERKRTRHHHDD